MSNKEIADAIIKAAHLLGNGNAATPMGAIEGLGLIQKESTTEIAEALNNIAESINHLADNVDFMTRHIWDGHPDWKKNETR
jgi:hypothetical protein